MTLTLDIVGTREVAERLRVSVSTVSTWVARPWCQFPAPLARVAAGPVWHWAQIRAWAQSHGRLPADDAATVSPADVRAYRASVLAEIDRAVSTDDADRLLAEPLAAPRRRAMVRDGRGRAVSQDGRGDGRGEWDTWYALSDAERARIVRRDEWTSPHGVAPDVLADMIARRTGTDMTADDAITAWIRATRLVGMADCLARGIVPRCPHGAGCTCGRSTAYGNLTPSEIFPTVADHFGDLELRRSGTYLNAEQWRKLSRFHDHQRTMRKAAELRTPANRLKALEQLRDRVTAEA